jgi:hypothetical protein
LPFHEPDELGLDVTTNRQEKGGNKRMVRDNKGKPPKGAKKSPDAHTLKATSEEQLLSKLQEESLKVHGDPLDPKKKRGETEEQK